MSARVRQLLVPLPTEQNGASLQRYLQRMIAEIATGINSLPDFVITSAANNDILRYSSSASQWLNQANIVYSNLPTGGGTWANGGNLAITGGTLTIDNFLSIAEIGGSPLTTTDVLRAGRTSQSTSTNVVLWQASENATPKFVQYLNNLSTGTVAAPGAVGASRIIASFKGRPYDGAAFVTTADIQFKTVNAQTSGGSSDHSSQVIIQTTPVTPGAGLTVVGIFDHDGSLTLGTTATAGTGKLYAGSYDAIGGATDAAYRSYVSGDTNARLTTRVDGRLLWGPGNAADDVNLYRSAADVLKTDDAMVMAGLTATTGTFSGDITTSADDIKAGLGATTGATDAILTLNMGTDSGNFSNDAAIYHSAGGTVYWRTGLVAGTNWKVYDDVNNIVQLTVAASLVTAAGFYQSSAPTSGTAAPWKFGSAVTSTTVAVATTAYIQIDVNGTPYKLAVVN